MKKLQEYETRWIAARNEYRRECSFFHKIRTNLRPEGQRSVAETMLIYTAKQRMSNAAKKFGKERELFIAQKTRTEVLSPDLVATGEEMGVLINRLAELIDKVRLPEEREKETKDTRFEKDKDRLIEAALKGIELSKRSKATGKSIEELASNFEGFEEPLEPGLQTLQDDKNAPDLPENIDWMAGARAERERLAAESVEVETTPQGAPTGEKEEANGMEKKAT